MHNGSLASLQRQDTDCTRCTGLLSCKQWMWKACLLHSEQTCQMIMSQGLMRQCSTRTGAMTRQSAPVIACLSADCNLYALCCISAQYERFNYEFLYVQGWLAQGGPRNGGRICQSTKDTVREREREQWAQQSCKASLTGVSRYLLTFPEPASSPS